MAHSRRDSLGGGDTEFNWLDSQGPGTGFAVSFILPFKRDDLWQELIADRLVGTDEDEDIKYTIIRPGNDEENPVSVGCVREAVFGAPIHGRSVSELLEMKPPSYIKWATLLQTDTIFEFMGRSDEVPPSIALALKENKRSKLHPEGGTTITMKYDFGWIQVHGIFCCLGPFAADFLKGRLEKDMKQKWQESMARRGYAPLSASRKMKTAQELKAQMERQAKLKMKKDAK